MSLRILTVIAGFDPAIHRATPRLLSVGMDARVKPGHDEVCEPHLNHFLNLPHRSAQAGAQAPVSTRKFDRPE